MSKTILLNHSNWHFTKENPGIPAAVMGEAIALPHRQQGCFAAGRRSHDRRRLPER